MTRIKIQQLANNPQKALLIFSHGAVYDCEITPPFTDEHTQHLAWYFEEYLKYPFDNQIKFQQIAASIQEYGENLFEQIFAQPNAYANFQDAVHNELSIEIIGSVAFHTPLGSVKRP